MQHDLTISFTKKPMTNGILTCKPITIRERILRLLLGSQHRMMILVPSDTVREIEINEHLESEDNHEQNERPLRVHQ